MSDHIIPVTTRREMKQFIELPLTLYKDNPYYVFPLRILQEHLLDKKKNPFYHHARVQLFILLRSGRVVGRIAAVVNNDHLAKFNDLTGFFGLYECIDDHQAAMCLFSAAEKWLKEMGMARMAGPENLSTNEEVGFLVKGFETRPVFLLPYNPPYYPVQAEHYGMTKLLDLFSYRIVTNEALVSKVIQVEKIRLRLEARGIYIRPINLKKFEAEVSGIREVYNTAFEENWGFLPLDEQEFYDYACNLRRITPAEMMLVAEKDGRIIGFICNVPDINQVLTVIKNGKLFPFGIMPWIYRKSLIDQIRVLILGVAREYRNQGVDLCLYAGTFLNGTRLGYRLAEAAYVMENNEQMTRILEALGAEPVKSYRLFSRNLSRD